MALDQASDKTRAREKLKSSNPDYWRQNMGKGWTSERRARQAELIRTWKPWEQSTGPRTAEGKARTARNGYKGGMREKLRELGRILREQADALERL